MFPLFPSIIVFRELVQEPVVYLDPEALYRKHADLNRYTVRTAQGPLRLTAEVGGNRWQVPYGQIRLSYANNWPEKHLKTLRSAYRGAAFFEHYESEIESILTYRYDFLYQLAQNALSFCLGKAGSASRIEILTPNTRETAQMPRSNPIITADTGIVGQVWAGIEYRSVFGAEFDGQVSILDALFCAGPHRLQAFFRKNGRPD